MSRKESFVPPRQEPGRNVASRFVLRESKTKKTRKDQSIFTYAHPGHGVQGESSN